MSSSMSLTLNAFTYTFISFAVNFSLLITLPIHHNVLQHTLHHYLPRLHALPYQSPEGR